MSFSDERDYAEERANRAEFLEPDRGEAMEPDHCVRGYDDETDRATACTDRDTGGECYHCPCCCLCFGCTDGARA